MANSKLTGKQQTDQQVTSDLCYRQISINDKYRGVVGITQHQ